MRIHSVSPRKMRMDGVPLGPMMQVPSLGNLLLQPTQPAAPSLFSVRHGRPPPVTLAWRPNPMTPMTPGLRRPIDAYPSAGLCATQPQPVRRPLDEMDTNLPSETTSCSSMQPTVTEKSKESARTTASRRPANDDKSYVERLREANLPVWKDDVTRKSVGSLASSARLKFSRHVASPQRQKPQRKKTPSARQRKSKAPESARPTSSRGLPIPPNTDAPGMSLYDGAFAVKPNAGMSGVRLFQHNTARSGPPPRCSTTQLSLSDRIQHQSSQSQLKLLCTPSRCSTTQLPLGDRIQHQSSHSQLKMLRVPSLAMFAPPPRDRRLPVGACQVRSRSCQPAEAVGGSERTCAAAPVVGTPFALDSQRGLAEDNIARKQLTMRPFGGHQELRLMPARTPPASSFR